MPRPSGSSASPGFSSSTMGSECSLRMSLQSMDRALVPAPVTPTTAQDVPVPPSSLAER